MKELIIVATDLYRPEQAPLPRFADDPGHRPALAGLAHLARFGAHEALRSRGWREWIAERLGSRELAALPPATVAAAAAPAIGTSDIAQASRFAWIASPVHLLATLSSVYLGPAGLLRLEPSELGELVRGFNEIFGASGWRLAPTGSGALIACGPEPLGDVETTAPERCLGASVAEALPRGPGAAALRRLGSEIEMWLHGQPLNALRAEQGKPQVSALWLWGGGASSLAYSRNSGDIPAARAALFSDDPYVEGLSHLTGSAWQAAPGSLASISCEVASTLITVQALERGAESLQEFDLNWIAPAIERLHRGELARLAVVANDRCAWLGARDRWKLWRRPARAALAAWC